jgi:hypothetical protein
VNWLGANLEDLAKLRSELDQVADEVAKVRDDITKSLHEVWWKGKDADTFREKWDGTHVGTLKRVSESLRIASSDIDEQRRVQENTSRG